MGEPTNPVRLGDMIKIGRRGSLSGIVTVTGVQGHAAYPHLADNPCGHPGAGPGADGPAARCRHREFPATNLEVTSIDVGNPATIVIPASATARFNVRFNDTWTATA